MNLKPRCRRPARYTHAHRSTAQQHNHSIALYRNNMLHCTALHCNDKLHGTASHHTVPHRALKERWRGGEEADPDHAEICGCWCWSIFAFLAFHVAD